MTEDTPIPSAPLTAEELAELRSRIYSPNATFLGWPVARMLATIATLRAEKAALAARISPVSPQGDDYVDELESCIGFLRHDKEVLEGEVADLQARLASLTKALEDEMCNPHIFGRKHRSEECSSWVCSRVRAALGADHAPGGSPS